jgi:Na+/H+-translocating membrane pyrophosphatase
MTFLRPRALVLTGLLAVALSWRTGVAYLAGGICSVIAGYAGMHAATHANVRTSNYGNNQVAVPADKGTYSTPDWGP